MMRNFLLPKAPKPPPSTFDVTIQPKPNTGPSRPTSETIANEVFTGYLSDRSEDEFDDNENIDNVDSPPADKPRSTTPSTQLPITSESFPIRPPPPPKRQKLDIPACTARRNAQEARRDQFKKALTAIEKLIASKRDVFQSGRNGLQAYRGWAVQSCLQMVVNNNRGLIDASQRAAESQGFAEKWGGRLVRRWVRSWVDGRKLPVSLQGCHVKVFTLLSDPVICAELRSYVRSNKWSMNPEKLAKFSQNKLVPEVAAKYAHRVTNIEMPQGLKKYLEVELFPRIHLKAGKGVSLRTARCWLHREGFKFTEHKKALYFDGHERLDVMDYRQKVCLPAMAKHRRRLVEYSPENVEKLGDKVVNNYVERILVLMAHDESTTQANDSQGKTWVLDGEHAIKKKGPGRGLHQSDCICSTIGWLKNGSQTLEYGKNYDGYWTGELFVKQACHSNCTFAN